MYSINSTGTYKGPRLHSWRKCKLQVRKREREREVCGAISHFLAIHMLNVFRYASIFGRDTFSLFLYLVGMLFFD